MAIEVSQLSQITHLKQVAQALLWSAVPDAPLTSHGVQEQTIGRKKKWLRLLTWEKVFFDALAINLWQKKTAWKYIIQSFKIAKMKYFYIYFLSEIKIVASSCLKDI